MSELIAIFLLIALAITALKALGFVLHLVLLPLKLAAGIFFMVLLLPFLLLGLPFLVLAGLGAVVAVVLFFLVLAAGGIAAIVGILSI